ncbi:MAG TPA: hypothetical protein VJ276_14595 [Thermoanaerobaculia bacterium]|nr:hypothetical protein [Thermoanaerobaculia bacterium]
MACSNFEIWDPIQANSRFCASAEGTDDDFLVGIRLVGADGSQTQFFTADLVPGPAHRSLSNQGYAARLTLTPGGTSPTVTLKAWIETDGGARPFACEWTATGAFKEQRITIVMIPA